MAPTKTENVDGRILSLAAEVAESTNDNVCTLLLKLREILKSASSVTKESKKLKEDLLRYDLTQYCSMVLRQDFSRVSSGWSTAASLADILSNCCVGIDPTEDADDFYNHVLPLAADNLLLLARRLQARFIRAIKDEEKSEFLRCFRTVTDSICWLFGGHTQLTDHVLKSDHFLQLLMTDDVDTGTVVISVLQNIIRVNSSVLHQADEQTIHCILDELVYKLSSTSNPVIGIVATKALLLMAESHDPIIQILDMRYKGLRILLSKQWTGKGFGRELGRLLDLLRFGSYQQAEMQKIHHAACVIQAAWKGFRLRKRFKVLPKAVTSLQRSFRNNSKYSLQNCKAERNNRAKREQEILHLQQLKEEENLKQQLQIHRRRTMRQFHERQLTMLEIVHAGQMDKHLEEVQQKSALLIQKHWRGYRERRNFHHQREALKQYKAAVTLQRAGYFKDLSGAGLPFYRNSIAAPFMNLQKYIVEKVLRFLKKRKCIKESFSPWKGPTAIPDARKFELQQKVDNYLKLHPVSNVSEERSKELHLEAQERLGQYLQKRRFEQKAEQRRDGLLAQINTDIKMLSNSPNLKESTEKDGDMFTSRSIPVATKAKQCHNAMLKYTRWPWWKKLGDEFIDEEDIPVDLNIESKSLYIAGFKTSHRFNAVGVTTPPPATDGDREKS